jgi:hypothetical protein
MWCVYVMCMGTTYRGGYQIHTGVGISMDEVDITVVGCWVLVPLGVSVWGGIHVLPVASWRHCLSHEGKRLGDDIGRASRWLVTMSMGYHL